MVGAADSPDTAAIPQQDGTASQTLLAPKLAAFKQDRDGHHHGLHTDRHALTGPAAASESRFEPDDRLRGSRSLLENSGGP
jgi:hypothetical protein